MPRRGAASPYLAVNDGSRAPGCVVEISLPTGFRPEDAWAGSEESRRTTVAQPTFHVKPRPKEWGLRGSCPATGSGLAGLHGPGRTDAQDACVGGST